MEALLEATTLRNSYTFSYHPPGQAPSPVMLARVLHSVKCKYRLSTPSRSGRPCIDLLCRYPATAGLGRGGM